MTGMFYKTLGYLVWHVGRTFLKWRYPVPSRRTVYAGIVGVAVLSLALGGAKRTSD